MDIEVSFPSCVGLGTRLYSQAIEGPNYYILEVHDDEAPNDDDFVLVPF